MKKRTILSVAGLVGSVTVLSYTMKRNKKIEPARMKEEKKKPDVDFEKEEEEKQEMDFDPELREIEPEESLKKIDPQKNVLVAGGKGMGKAKYCIKPVLKRDDCSFAVLSANEEMLKEMENELKEKGLPVENITLGGEIADITKRCDPLMKGLTEEHISDFVSQLSEHFPIASGRERAEYLILNFCLRYLSEVGVSDTLFSSMFNMISTEFFIEKEMLNKNDLSAKNSLFAKTFEEHLADASSRMYYDLYSALPEKEQVAALKALKAKLLFFALFPECFQPNGEHDKEEHVFDPDSLYNKKKAYLIYAPAAGDSGSIDPVWRAVASILVSMIWQQRYVGSIPVQLIIDGVDLVKKDAFILFERSEFISAMVICSEISQLVSVANRKSILDQFPIKIWMGGTGMMTIRYFSKKAGKYPESDPSKRSQNDLLPADALLELPDDICLICQEGSLGELCEKDHISFT